MASNRPDWHTKKEVTFAADNFYHQYARQPDSAEAKQSLGPHLDKIHSYLNKQGFSCQAPEYVGSTYEGLKLNDGLEFDVMVVMDGGKAFDAVPTDRPDYSMLKPNPGVQRDYLKRTTTDDGFASATKMARGFQGHMDKLSKTPEFRGGGQGMVLRTHGPAVQMDVSKEGKFWYSVDLVPTVAVKGNYYVAKGNPKQPAAWLHSYSVEMKQKFKDIDRDDNGHRKQVLRMYKGVCHKERDLKLVSSHHAKMIALNELKEHPEKTWKANEIVPRLQDLFARTEKYLKSGNMPHHFEPGVNMISHIPPATRSNMANRMHNLHSKQGAFASAMSCF